MSEKIRARLVHALLSFMLTAGLLMPLLGILEPSFLSPALLAWSALIILLFEAAAFNRIAAFVSAGAGAVFLLIWLFAMNGLLAVSDVTLALVLRFTGIRTALPLAGSAALVLLTVGITLVSCFSCLRRVSILPAGILCFTMILLIYLSGSNDMIPWFLPALVALLLLLMTDRFPETPVLPLVPFAALLVAAAFLLAGNGTGSNPLREKADELRQAVLDRLFFTEPRDVFSLSTEGFYPEGQDQLGGKPEPSDHVVMQVSTPRTVYLRGVILNQYTGRNWINTTGGRRYLRQSPRLARERAALFDEDLPPRTVRNALCEPSTVSVRMLCDSASTLFVPQRVRNLVPGGDLVPYFSNSSELFVTRNLKAGDTYSVSAPLFQAGDPGLGTLIEVCSTLEDSRYEQVAETYTALPDHLEGPVYDLAREAASVATAPYERALAIQTWLSRSCRYTLDVDEHPVNMDFVTRFLLDTREGYCTYFASAMTVLCRMVGIPARYVEGYLAEPDENGEALVTGLSAHAWTEVYFKGFGWLTFDATPRRTGISGGQNDPDPGPTPSPEPEENIPTPPPEEPEPDLQEDDPTPDPDGVPPTPETPDEPTPAPPDQPETPSDNPPETPPKEPGSSSTFPWWLILLLLILMGAAFRVWMTSPAFLERRAKTETEKFDIWAQEITDLLHAESLTRNTGETPMAFGRRVDRSGLFSVALGPVGECVSLIRYSRAEAEETDTGLIRDTSVLLRGELSRPAVLRYFIRRFFVPRSRRESL